MLGVNLPGPVKYTKSLLNTYINLGLTPKPKLDD